MVPAPELTLMVPWTEAVPRMVGHSAAAPLRVDVISEPCDFSALREEWRKLLACSRADSVFLTWEWLHTWWKHLGERRELFIVTVRSGAELVGIAPLTMTRTSLGPLSFRVLEFAGTGDVGSDYLDFILKTGHESAAARAIVDFIVDAGVALRLPSVGEDSAVQSFVEPIFVERGWQSRRVPMQVCPFIDISEDSWDAYLAKLGPSHRYNVRRRLRNLQKSYVCRMQSAHSESERRAALQSVVDLHLQRWTRRGGSNAFHTARLIAFHDEFTAAAREQGWLRLNTLTLDGRVAAAFYGLRYGDKFQFYQCGFDEKFRRHSIGLVMMALTIKSAIEERAGEYDLLHGDESYKFLWACQTRPLMRIELYPPSRYGKLQRNSVIAVDGAKKIAKRFIAAFASRQG